MRLISITLLLSLGVACGGNLQQVHSVNVAGGTKALEGKRQAIPPAISLTATPNSGASPLLVTFTANCSTCVAYAWAFGDGSSNTVPGPVQKHTYSAGSYDAFVVAADAKGHQTSAQLIVNVSCGSDTSPACANTSLAPIAYPSEPPNVGGLIGAGATFADPVFGTPGVRITDASFDPSTYGTANDSYTVSNGGSADNNWWSTDSKLTLVGNAGGFKYLVGLNPATLQVTRPYAGITSGCPRGTGKCSTFGGWSINGNLEFSTVDPCKLYQFNGLAINSYVFGSDVVPFPNSCSSLISGPPAASTVLSSFIVNSPAGCTGTACNGLPSDFGSPTWSGEASTVDGDAVFGGAFSSSRYHYGTSTGQNSGYYAVVWSPTKGVLVLNTLTGAITSEKGWAGGAGLNCTSSGCIGMMTTADRFTIHNVKFNPDGSRLYIQWAGTCTGTCLGDNPYVWIVGTNVVYPSEGDKKYSGHWVAGYEGIMNGPGNPSWQIYYHPDPISGPAGAPIAINNLPSGGPPNLDGHFGWQMNNRMDTGPILAVWDTGSLRNWGLLPYDQPTGPWWSEIDLVGTKGDGLIHREALTFNSGYSTLFSAQWNITTASRQCIAVGSDWFNIRNAGGTSTTCIPKGPTWKSSFKYKMAGDSPYTITPSSAYNPEGYSYQISGTCSSGAYQPTQWNQTIGSTQSDGTCTWTNIGVPSGVNACGTDVYVWCLGPGEVDHY
jgi:hypothetical protein